MRASRVITMLTQLQRRGQLTAAQLAQELEVSPRTILRDVETLSAAGIPIYATQGAGGGIALMDGFAQTLETLTLDDAGGLLWAGQQELASLLGFGPAAGAARAALLGALPVALAEAAEEAGAWFVHDAEGRQGLPFDPSLLALTARAVRLRVCMRTGVPVGEVKPLGIVLEGGSWLLVHLTADGPDILSLADLTGPFALGVPFDPPADFDLQLFWRRQRILPRPPAS